MKKILSLLAVCALALTGCSMPQGKKLTIVCTGFAEYDWTRQILGDRAEEVEVKYLLTNGADLHSYQPSILDVANISDCDLLIFTEGESSQWVEAFAEDAQNFCKLPLPEGTACTEEHDHEEHEHTADEHTWLSIRLAEAYCGQITEALCKVDAGCAAQYRSNCERYTAELQALDADFAAAAAEGRLDTIVVADRFPFRYLAADYDLQYAAAFEGCSAETEASFETIVELAKTVDALDCRCLCTIEGSDQSVAQTVISATASKDQEIVVLNSLQSVDQQQAEEATYLSLMRENLESLRKALS